MDIRPGDTVRVWTRVADQEKTRLQAFEGLVLARRGGVTPGATFTVRRVASGVGVEKIFLFFSPVIDKIEIIRRARVRRAKLYYIRRKSARDIRRKMKGFAEFVPVTYAEAKPSAASGEADEESLEEHATEDGKAKKK